MIEKQPYEKRYDICTGRAKITVPPYNKKYMDRNELDEYMGGEQE